MRWHNTVGIFIYSGRQSFVCCSTPGCGTLVRVIKLSETGIGVGSSKEAKSQSAMKVGSIFEMGCSVLRVYLMGRSSLGKSSLLEGCLHFMIKAPVIEFSKIGRVTPELSLANLVGYDADGPNLILNPLAGS